MERSLITLLPLPLAPGISPREQPRGLLAAVNRVDGFLALGLAQSGRRQAGNGPALSGRRSPANTSSAATAAGQGPKRMATGWLPGYRPDLGSLRGAARPVWVWQQACQMGAGGYLDLPNRNRNRNPNRDRRAIDYD